MEMTELQKKWGRVPFDKLVVVQVRIGGDKLLMNPKTPAVLKGLRTGIHDQVKRDEAPEKTCKRRIYREGNKPDGRIGIPSGNLWASLRDAGASKRFKVDNAQITTKGPPKTTQLPALVLVAERFIPLKNNGDNGEPKWEVDMRGGNLKQKGSVTAVCVIRPLFPDWETEPFHLLVNADWIGLDMVRDLLFMAGMKQGLCDFRPSCGGDFGMFCILDWKIVEGQEYLEGSVEKDNTKEGSTRKRQTVSATTSNDKDPRESAQKKRRKERQKLALVPA